MGLQDKVSSEAKKENGPIDFDRLKREQVRGFINILEDAYRRLDWITLNILHSIVRKGSFILMEELLLRIETGLGLRRNELERILGWLDRRRLIRIREIVPEDPPEPKRPKRKSKKKASKEWRDIEVSLTEAGRLHYVDLVYCLALERTPEVAEDLKRQAESLAGVKVEEVDCGALG